ncbi:MAG: alpha/beta fold hydrolase [Gemmatimonadetes bacterium]|nr:alpha/beta fold hydrolase [Gemmatimonadota bacterium]
MSEHTFTPRPFRPAWWLPGAHAQTIAGRYIRPPHGVHYRRERLETPDGDFLDLDFASVDGAPAAGADAPLCVAVHGLEGSAQSSYMLETCRALAEHGIRTVAMNFRSCSGEPNRTARFYHAGETGDLAFLLDVLAARFPNAALLGAGFSLGANVLLKYLGERGEVSRIRAATAISIPFDLGRGADKLAGSFMGRVYTRHFVRRLVAKYRLKRAAGVRLDGVRLDERRSRRWRSFRDLDDALTARLHGFQDADDYYTRSSCAIFLHAIRVPTLLVHALDDPFVDAGAIPHGVIQANPHLHPALVPRGGHVGFIAGTPRAPRFWAEREAARFLAGRAGAKRA